MVLIFILFCILWLKTGADLATECEPTTPERLKTEEDFWIYRDFVSMSELNIECDLQRHEESFKRNDSFTIYLDFARSGVLNSSVQIGRFGRLAQLNVSVNFVLSHVQGFDVETPGPLIEADQALQTLLLAQITFLALKFDFYYRGSLVDARLCNADVFASLPIRLFSHSANTSFVLGEKCDFGRPVCPFVFKNAMLDRLVFLEMENNRLTRRLISFLPIQNPSNLTFSLKSQFRHVLIVRAYSLSVGESLLDPTLFARVLALTLDGQISIESGLLKPLTRLASFSLYATNARSFFHASTNDWMTHLFEQGAIFESRAEKTESLRRSSDRRAFLKLLLSDNSDLYSFPDEDFCLFRHFPYKKLVLASVHPNRPTCTKKFLVQNNEIVLAKFAYYQASYYAFYDAREVDAACNLSARLELCSNAVPLVEAAYEATTYNDVKHVLMWLDFLGPVVSFSLVALAAFVLNLLAVLVLRHRANRKEKLFEAKMFAYMLMGSAFSCAECLIYQLRLINICMGSGSLFCSAVQTSMFAQLFGLVVGGYASETLKTCGMLTGLLFTLQRYVDTSKSENRLLVAFSKLRISRVLAFVFITSALSSVPKIFDYKLWDEPVFYADTPAAFYVSLENLKRVDAKSMLFLLHYALNDLVLLAVNLVFDVKLVGQIKANLKQKLKTAEGEADRVRLDKELKKKRSVERRANMLIFSSVDLYIVCRLPELAGILFFYLERTTDTNTFVCLRRYFCYFIANTIEYLYMLSYSFNVAFYYHFNSNFRKGFRRFLRLKDKE